MNSLKPWMSMCIFMCVYKYMNVCMYTYMYYVLSEAETKYILG